VLQEMVARLAGMVREPVKTSLCIPNLAPRERDPLLLKNKFFEQWSVNASVLYDEHPGRNMLTQHYKRRLLFRTRGNLLGLGPPSVKTGDLLCIVPGGRVPLALRRIPDSERFLLQGEAYVHGVMHGELVKGKPSGK
jgi:hypothetical protein